MWIHYVHVHQQMHTSFTAALVRMCSGVVKYHVVIVISGFWFPLLRQSVVLAYSLAKRWLRVLAG